MAVADGIGRDRQQARGAAVTRAAGDWMATEGRERLCLHGSCLHGRGV
jgi:hypothetical protein